MTAYISNALSLNMFHTLSFTLDVKRVTLDGAKAYVASHTRLESFVGHKETAAIVSGLLQEPVAFYRGDLLLSPGDSLLVAQYTGPRLPEGATSLPEGAKMSWFLVSVKDRSPTLPIP